MREGNGGKGTYRLFVSKKGDEEGEVAGEKRQFGR